MPMKRHHFSAGRCMCAVFLVGSVGLAVAQVSMDPAKITRVENRVIVGEIKEGQASAGRPAVVSDPVKANNFIKTGSESRAELQFKDTSLVRVGQNSVFSFEARSRTLSLDKGDMLFYAAPNQGVRTIKTPALTAAITGTLGKVTPDMLAILRGSTTITIGGRNYKIPAGWAVKVVNRKARFFRFDPEEATRGRLYSMGPLPEDTGIQIKRSWAAFLFPSLHDANAIDSALVNSNRQPRMIPPPVMTQTVTPTVTVTPQPTTTVNNPVNRNPAGVP
jgi:hypothetical protein